MRRRRIGKRRYNARFEEHDGSLDSHGSPTYTEPGDWDTVIESWPCELLTTTGGEKLNGRQVQATATAVFYGAYQYIADIKENMRVVVDDVTYYVVAAYDPEGDRRELRVECRLDIE